MQHLMNFKHLKKYLPKGYAAKVAEDCGVSESLVYQVFIGKKKNLDVAERLLDLADKHKKKMEEIQARSEAI